MKLAYVGGNIEKEGEPADPVKKLNLADSADLKWETPHRVPDLFEERDDADFLSRWRPFKTRVALFDAEARDQDRAAKGEGGYNA